MSVGPRLASRRTALAASAAALGVVALTGCDALDGSTPAAGPSSTPADTPSDTSTETAADPDGALVEAVVSELTEVSGLVAVVGARYRDLADQMTALHDLHLAHLAALDAPAPEPVARRPRSSGAGAAASVVRRREQLLHTQLVDAAVAAQSGSLARLFASMSAAVGQQLDRPTAEACMTTLAALQATLAAEHAAVYLYGVLGGRTSAAATPRLLETVTAAYTEHRSRRDLLVRTITDLDETPVAAEPVYALPHDLTSPAQVNRTGRELEQSCAATYAYLVANTAGDQRRWAIGALNEAALRALDFGGRPEDFPGA